MPHSELVATWPQATQRRHNIAALGRRCQCFAWTCSVRAANLGLPRSGRHKNSLLNANSSPRSRIYTIGHIAFGVDQGPRQSKGKFRPATSTAKTVLRPSKERLFGSLTVLTWHAKSESEMQRNSQNDNHLRTNDPARKRILAADQRLESTTASIVPLVAAHTRSPAHAGRRAATASSARPAARGPCGRDSWRRGRGNRPCSGSESRASFPGRW
jgi:hypothetical protein